MKTKSNLMKPMSKKELKYWAQQKYHTYMITGNSDSLMAAKQLFSKYQNLGGKLTSTQILRW